MTGTTRSITAKDAQTLKLNRHSKTVTGLQVTRAARFGSGRELSATDKVGPDAGVDIDRTETVKISFCFTLKQLADEYRNDWAC